MNSESIDSVFSAALDLWGKVPRDRMKERVALVVPDRTLVETLNQELRDQLNSAATEELQMALWRKAMDYQALSNLLYTWNQP